MKVMNVMQAINTDNKLMALFSGMVGILLGLLVTAGIVSFVLLS